MEQAQHNLHLSDRKKLDITGVSNVESMSETQIVVSLADTKLIVKGHGLSVSLLDIEAGKLSVTGNSIFALEYTSGKKEKFTLGKIFK